MKIGENGVVSGEVQDIGENWMVTYMTANAEELLVLVYIED
jgi:hypothetical protein